MDQVYLEIRDAETMVSFVKSIQQKTGLLAKISPEKLQRAMEGKKFPMRVPVNLDGVVDIAANPILKKMFGKKVEESTIKYLTAMAGS